MELDKSPLGKSVTVCGYTIKRMKIGALLEALDLIGRIPKELVMAWFPGMTAGEITQAVTNGNGLGQMDWIFGMLKVMPRYIMGLISKLTGIDERVLNEDENLGPTGLAHLLAAWLEVNEIENFMILARGGWKATAGGDFTGLLPQGSEWALGSRNYSTITTLGKFMRYLGLGATGAGPKASAGAR